ncbi:MAG: hypothetical protein RR439_03755 [Carnobacterium sp.]
MTFVTPETTINKETILGDQNCKKFDTTSRVVVEYKGGTSLFFNPIVFALDKNGDQIGKKNLTIIKSDINHGKFTLKNGTYQVDGTVTFCNSDLENGNTINNIGGLQIVFF